MENHEILDAEEQLRVAMVNSDIDQLSMLISDDLLFTTHYGALISKEDDIAIHKSGSLKFHSIELSSPRIKVHHNFSVVSVQAKIEAIVNGLPSNGIFMFTRVWSNQTGFLKVVAGHASQKA